MPPVESRRAPVTPAEYLVLEALWALGVGTVAAIQEALPRGRKLAYNTVLTQVRFLLAKGYVKRERVGRADVYRARHSRDEVRRRVLRRFLDAYFDGDPEILALANSELARREPRGRTETPADREDAPQAARRPRTG